VPQPLAEHDAAATDRFGGDRLNDSRVDLAGERVDRQQDGKQRHQKIRRVTGRRRQQREVPLPQRQRHLLPLQRPRDEEHSECRTPEERAADEERGNHDPPAARLNEGEMDDREHSRAIRERFERSNRASDPLHHLEKPLLERLVPTLDPEHTHPT
jgi:hypothetical protein